MATINPGQKITPFLWYDGNVEEAVKFYTKVFKGSKILSMNRMNDGKLGKKGKVFTASFIIGGQEIMALDGGPHYKLTPAFSLFVRCKTQKEVDTLWDKLSNGGRKDRCGWLQDKFGLSWQIIPDTLGELLYDKDPVKANNVMQAMLQMDKIDIKKLKEAYKKK